MRTILVCPFCGKSMNRPEGSLATQFQCVHCGAAFALPGDASELSVDVDEETGLPLVRGLPPPPKPLAPVLVSSSVEPDSPIRQTACPQCGFRLRADADRCAYCGANLTDARHDRPWEKPGGGPRRDLEAHRGNLIQTLGALSLALSLPGLGGIGCLYLTPLCLLAVGTGIAGLVMAKDDLAQMEQRIMDPAGRQPTEKGEGLAIAGLIVGGLGALVAMLARMSSLFGN